MMLNSKLISLLIVGTVVLGILISLFMPFALRGTTMIEHKLLGCEGIEHFYTGHGFEEDFYNAQWHYMNCKGKDKGYTQPISDLINCDVDPAKSCEDFSNAMLCLAEMYNRTCWLSGEVHYSYNFVFHIGLACLKNGEYVTMY